MRKLTFSSKSVKCVLWDLDGTLVSTGGSGIRALNRAVFELYGVAESMKDIKPAGKTDPAIIREIFVQVLGRDCSPEEMLEVQDRYLRHLPQECATAPDYEVIEGVPELLKDLSELGMVSGLGTGNLERGARIKLERAGLNPYLPFGGFGSDSESRPDLLKAGRAKAEALSGRRFDPQEVFIIGDTERDILAAREAGFKVIAVATGNSPVDHLARFKPDHVIEDFSRPDEFLEMICGN